MCKILWLGSKPKFQLGDVVEYSYTSDDPNDIERQYFYHGMITGIKFCPDHSPTMGWVYDITVIKEISGTKTQVTFTFYPDLDVIEADESELISLWDGIDPIELLEKIISIRYQRAMKYDRDGKLNELINKPISDIVQYQTA